MDNLDIEKFNKLSQREKELITGLAKGYSRSQLAEEMNIALSTFDGYRKSIRQKLGIKGFIQWGQIIIQFELLNKKNLL